MVDVDAEDVPELAAAAYQQPVEAFAAYGADPALHVRVRVRRLDGRTDDLDSIARKESVECPRELRVAIIDQTTALAGYGRRVRSGGCAPAAASTPCPVYRCRRRIDPAIPDRDQGEHVQAAQPHRVE